MTQSMPEPKTMIEDDRPIIFLSTTSPGMYWDVGKNGVTKIVAYNDTDMAFTQVWLLVYEGNTLIERVNLRHVDRIGYQR